MKVLFIYFVGMLVTLNCFAQTRGMITDRSTGEKLPGATISISGSLQGVSSYATGEFEIDAHAGDTLQASFVGYVTKKILVTYENPYLKITLESYASQLNDLIVTGVFDPRKRIESSVAVTTISSAQLEHIVPNSSAELLRLEEVYLYNQPGEN